MSAALAANSEMASTQDGNVVVGDEVIDTSSLTGVATAVVMNAKARGELPAVRNAKKNERNPAIGGRLGRPCFQREWRFIESNHSSKSLRPLPLVESFHGARL